MAGATVDRELSATSTTRFAVATPADDAAIRRLLRDNPMRGTVNLTFEREPDYFHGTNLVGGEDQTIMALSNSHLVCMGRCTRRECWVDGAVRRVGYLAELRLDAAARGRFEILREGYRFFHSLQRDTPADLYFTSISADNHRARLLLEKGVRGLPTYGFLAELDTLLVAVPRRPRAPKLHFASALQEHIPAILRLLNGHARRHQLATVWTAGMLRTLDQQGLPLERFFVALDGGRIVACGALWDQRGFHQTVIRGYAPTLSVVRPLVNAVSGLLRIPRLPQPGSVLAHAFLSPLAFEIGTETMLPDLINAVFPAATKAGVEFLTLALPTADSRLPVLRRRFATRTWRTRLYRVDWPDRTPVEFGVKGAAFLPDVALL